MNRAGKPTPAFFETLAAQHIELEPGDLEKLQTHLEALLEANERFNLTAVRDPAEAWVRHAADSLSLVPFVAEAGAACIIDVGTGGGFPGVAHRSVFQHQYARRTGRGRAAGLRVRKETGDDP